MRMSIGEFREMIEDHAYELRRSQEDFNEMCDQKEEKINSLIARAVDYKNALESFKLSVINIIVNYQDSAPRHKLDLIQQAYGDVVDGLDGF
jgi:hypothetical protein